jgi:hypothetical protein
MQYTPLSTIIDRMDRWPAMYKVEPQYKVRDLDTALRELKREFQPPWTLRKGTLRLFSGIDTYAVAADHDEVAYIDKQNMESYADTARFYNTSIQQFFEMINGSRNLMSEIWDNGTKKLGLKYINQSLGDKLLSQAEDSDEYTFSDDVESVTKDTVNYIKGSASIRVSVHGSTNLAVVKNIFTSFSDLNYKNKYHFRNIYLSGVPAFIEMKLQTDDNNYLISDNITTQFDGSPFKANSWNIIAYDLNLATEQGVFDSSNISSEVVILNSTPNGLYYLDESNVKEWELFDYWYYSNFFIKTSASNVPDKKFFYTTDYEMTDSLTGDDEWVDVIMYDAMLITINVEENKTVYGEIKERREKAWFNLMKQYPSMVPLISTKYTRFNNNPGVSGGFNID